MRSVSLGLKVLGWVGAAAALTGAALSARRVAGRKAELEQLRSVLELFREHNEFLCRSFEVQAAMGKPGMPELFFSRVEKECAELRQKAEAQRSAFLKQLEAAGHACAALPGFTELMSYFRHATLVQQARLVRLMRQMDAAGELREQMCRFRCAMLGFSDEALRKADTEQRLRLYVGRCRAALQGARALLAGIGSTAAAEEALPRLRQQGAAYVHAREEMELYAVDDAAAAAPLMQEWHEEYRQGCRELRPVTERLHAERCYGSTELEALVQRLLPK